MFDSRFITRVPCILRLINRLKIWSVFRTCLNVTCYQNATAYFIQYRIINWLGPVSWHGMARDALFAVRKVLRRLAYNTVNRGSLQFNWNPIRQPEKSGSSNWIMRHHWLTIRDVKGTGFCGTGHVVPPGTAKLYFFAGFCGTGLGKINGTGHVPSLLHPCLLCL